jgi:hypothetical protein
MRKKRFNKKLKGIIMIIVFNGDTLDLEKRLRQFSEKDEKATLDFMLENFKILTKEQKALFIKQFFEKAVEFFHESLKTNKSFGDVADEIAKFAYNNFCNFTEIPKENNENEATNN